MTIVKTNSLKAQKERRAQKRRRSRIQGLFLISLGTAFLIALVAILARPDPSSQIGPARIGQPAPDLVLNDLSGKQVRLSDFTGRPVLINAWATWCPPCRAEMPDLHEFFLEHRAAGFTLLAINAGESQSTVSEFITQTGFTFPVLLDPNSNTLSRLGIFSYPTSILIGRDGIVKTIRPGMLTPEMLQAEIAPLLAQ